MVTNDPIEEEINQNDIDMDFPFETWKPMHDNSVKGQEMFLKQVKIFGLNPQEYQRMLAV